MRATLPPMPASQALKLNNLSPTDQWADSLIHSLNRLDRLSNDSDTATVLRAPSPASETTSSHRSLASRPPSAYTPTTTTTGFEPTPPSASHHHSCPSSRAASPASAAIPAASQTGIHLPLPLPPSVRRFSMATTPPRREPARSRPISCPSSIGRYRESCFGRVGSSPPRSRLRDWPSIDALALGEGRGVVETGLKGEGEEEEKEEEEEERESKVASGLIVSFMPAAVLEREKGAMSLAMEEEGEEMVSPGEKEKKTPLVQSSSTSIPPLVPKGPDNVTTSSQATQTETEAHQVEKQVEEKEKVVDEEVRKEEVVKQQAVQEEMMKREEKVVMDEVIKEVAVKEDMSLLMAAVIPSSAPTPRDSAVTLTSTDQKEETLTPPQKVEKKEQQQDKAEKEPSKAKLLEQMLPARPVDPPTPPTQLNHGRDWEMRKTMRPTKNNNSPTTLSHTSSSHTYTSTYLMAQPKLSPPLHSHTPCQPQPQPHTQSQGTNPLHHHPHQPPPPHPINVLNPALLARGAARTAFTHHRWGLTQPSITTSGFLRGGEPPPIPATSWSSDPHGGVTAAKAKTTASGGSVQGPKGKGGEKGEGLGQNCKGEGGGEEEGKPESNSNSSSNYHSDGKKKGKKSVSFAPGTSETGGGGGGGGAIGFDKRAAVRLARTVGHLVWRGVVAYWRVVKPVFEAESEVRKRVDGGKGTWEDWGMCGLAVGFVFLTVSGVVWAVRGVVWVVRVVGEVGGLLRCVLGL